MLESQCNVQSYFGIVFAVHWVFKMMRIELIVFDI